jgi:hydrogenase maturation protease
VKRVLVAGVGNIFLGDDGFGVEVVRRLATAELPSWVQVADYGISGLHLAYELLGGYETAILVDAAPQGGEAGTVYLIEPGSGDEPAGPLDAHGMQPDVVLHLLRLLGGDAGRVLVVGCEPGCVEEGIGLSPRVAAAVPRAVELVTELAYGAVVESGGAKW